ncbi:AraC family transcriptional regulator [Actinokineospora xionganensis]|uniref:Helix-turn-helix transcriptional regulator n=1 Tax=Actinokineospora xionganensis TaxID=2684470 RepID=A0ABR7L1A9_9PSEU|nr:AraC family transcriptional regulator [Actinokineospora xionganensis]MBC6446239.1 helix-turn-helix transcriptional regulator [Actinokineospora xionganensis]
MVKNGQPPIPEIAYSPPSAAAAGVEVLTLADLRERARGQDLSSPQRPEFHLLFAVDAGALWHAVDFTPYTVTAGSWLWVRPGQVQRFGDLAAAEGAVVFFQSSFLSPATARVDDRFGHVHWHATGSAGAAARGALDHLAREYADPALPDAVRTELLGHLLAALLLRIAHLRPGTPAVEPGETFRRFRDAVEHDFAAARQVGHYARMLGYSPRTLSRATLAAAGVGAKEFIDLRVILEAKRLLAHGDHPVALIAHQLGFPDSTNFSKFFHHRVGRTPGAFRTSARAPL